MFSKTDRNKSENPFAFSKKKRKFCDRGLGCGNNSEKDINKIIKISNRRKLYINQNKENF